MGSRPDPWGGGICWRVEHADLERGQSEDIAMRLAGRRAGAAIAGNAEIGPGLLRADRQPLAIYHPRRQTARIAGNVVDHPMPPSGAAGRVWIVEGEQIALRTLRRILPGQRRR